MVLIGSTFADDDALLQGEIKPFNEISREELEAVFEE
jgi:hypothetical protein